MLYPLLFYTDLSEMALQPAYNRMLNGCGPGASPRDWAVLVRQAMQRLGYPQSIRDAEQRLLTSLADVLAVDTPAASQKAYSESLNRYKEWRQKLTAIEANAYRK